MTGIIMVKHQQLLIVIVSILIVVMLYTVHWRNKTLEKFEHTEKYLILTYVSGKKKLVPYDDIEDIKYFKNSRHGRMCGLHFYLKENQSIKTRENISCSEINMIRNEILQKANQPSYDWLKKYLKSLER